MKVKTLLLGLGLVFLMLKPSYAFVSECYDEDCALPPAASASQFLLDDLNNIPDIDEVAAIPTEGQFWPVQGIITGLFGKWRGGHHYGHYHAGVDIAAPVGTNIVVPIDGTVAFVGHKGGYGRTLIIEHEDGIATLYGHTSEILVSEGEVVKKGQLVAKVGSSGHSTGPHLHYEVRMEGSPVSPLARTAKLQTAKF